jgi:U2-associated protein SR140
MSLLQVYVQMTHLYPRRLPDYISSVISCIILPVVAAMFGNTDNCMTFDNCIDYRFEARMASVFSHLHTIYTSFDGRIKADNFRQQIMAITSVWETWMVFNNSNVEAWIKIFLGRGRETEERKSETPVEEIVEKPVEKKSKWKSVVETSGKEAEVAPMSRFTSIPLNSPDDSDDEEDVDGEEMEEDVDGMPMEEEEEDVDGQPMEEDEDVDGEPMEDDDEDVDGLPMEEPRDENPAPVVLPPRRSPEVEKPSSNEQPRPQKRQRMRAADMFTDS